MGGHFGRHLKNSLAILSAATVIGGCSILGSNAPSLGENFQKCWKDKAHMEADTKVYSEFDQKLERFLNCYLGPMIGDGESVSEDVQLLRGHIAAALVARYGAFNITGEVGEVFNIRFRSYDKLQTDAEDILTGLYKVEYELRRDSGLFKDLEPRALPPDFLPEVRKIYKNAYRRARLVELADLTKDAGTPTFRRGKLVIANIIATAGAPSPAGVSNAIRDLKTGMIKLGVIDKFGGAYLQDAQSYLTCVHRRQIDNGRKPVGGTCADRLEGDWQNWDGRLQEACDRLAKVAQLKLSCLPGQYK